VTATSPYPVGMVVQWHEATTGARRIGTIASSRTTRAGSTIYRVNEGRSSDPALYMPARNSRGVLDFPGQVLTPYARRWWPNPTPGGPPIDHDPATTCEDCGSPEPGGACDADCPTRDDDPNDARAWLEQDEQHEQRTGDGSPLTLI